MESQACFPSTIIFDPKEGVGRKGHLPSLFGGWKRLLAESKLLAPRSVHIRKDQETEKETIQSSRGGDVWVGHFQDSDSQKSDSHFPIVGHDSVPHFNFLPFTTRFVWAQADDI